MITFGSPGQRRIVPGERQVYSVTAPTGRGSLKAMKVFHLLLIVPVMACAPIAAWAADDPYAAQLFAQRCASCHEAAAGGAARIPAVSQLKAMTPTAILKTLETGVMRAQAAALSTNERQAVANFLGTAVTTERRREEIANLCPAGAGWKSGPGWSNWGA